MKHTIAEVAYGGLWHCTSEPYLFTVADCKQEQRHCDLIKQRQIADHNASVAVKPSALKRQLSLIDDIQYARCIADDIKLFFSDNLCKLVPVFCSFFLFIRRRFGLAILRLRGC